MLPPQLSLGLLGAQQEEHRWSDAEEANAHSAAQGCREPALALGQGGPEALRGIFDHELLWRCELPLTEMEFVVSSGENSPLSMPGPDCLVLPQAQRWALMPPLPPTCADMPFKTFVPHALPASDSDWVFCSCFNEEVWQEGCCVASKVRS